MSWENYGGYGNPLGESLTDICANCANKRGVIEIQVLPWAWERACVELGTTRPVTLTRSEDRFTFETAACGRVVRFYAVMGDYSKGDFRFRVVEK